MKIEKHCDDVLNIRLDVTEHYILYPNDVVTLRHYNGCTLKFVSPGFCKFVYRGGFGFDIVPLNLAERDINITLIEPPIKQPL